MAERKRMGYPIKIPLIEIMLKPAETISIPLGSKPRKIEGIQTYLIRTGPEILSTHLTFQPYLIFLADSNNGSIIIVANKVSEFTVNVRVKVTEFFFDQQNNAELTTFKPFDICVNKHFPILAVCGEHSSGLGKIVLFEMMIEGRPCFELQLKLRKIIPTEKKMYSLCFVNNLDLFFCLDENSKLHMVSYEGETIKTISVAGFTNESVGEMCQIRANDLQSNSIFLSASNLSTIFCYDYEDKSVDSWPKGNNHFFDFDVDIIGDDKLFWFATDEQIVATSQENLEDTKIICKFPKKSEVFPLVSVDGKYVAVYFKIDGQHEIQISRIR